MRSPRAGLWRSRSPRLPLWGLPLFSNTAPRSHDRRCQPTCRGPEGRTDTERDGSRKRGREQRLPPSLRRSLVPAQGQPPPRAHAPALCTHTHTRSHAVAVSWEATANAESANAEPPRRGHRRGPRRPRAQRLQPPSCTRPARGGSPFKDTWLNARCQAAARARPRTRLVLSASHVTAFLLMGTPDGTAARRFGHRNGRLTNIRPQMRKTGTPD